MKTLKDTIGTVLNSIFARLDGWFAEPDAVLSYQPSDHWFFRDSGQLYGRFRQYHEKVLQPYAEIWDEAMLAATVQFVRQEPGIRKVYCHTFQSGNRLKHISENRPPESLYTRLPKRFGFRETDAAPQFIGNTRYLKKKLAAMEGLSWYLLEVNMPLGKY
jgi:hypothetical protein